MKPIVSVKMNQFVTVKVQGVKPQLRVSKKNSSPSSRRRLKYKIPQIDKFIAQMSVSQKLQEAGLTG